MPLVRQWGVLDLEGLDAEGERARTKLAEALHALDGQASRFVEPREEAAARKTARSGA
jgi:acyl-[acyl-carrier-protein] desaturase